MGLTHLAVHFPVATMKEETGGISFNIKFYQGGSTNHHGIIAVVITITIELVKEVVYILLPEDLQGSWVAGIHHSGPSNGGQVGLSYTPLLPQPHPFPPIEKGKNVSLSCWPSGPQSPPTSSLHTTCLLLEFPSSPINPASQTLNVGCSSHSH